MKIYRVNPPHNEFHEEDVSPSFYFGSKAKATAWLKRYNRRLWKDRIERLEENHEYVEENYDHGDTTKRILDDTLASSPEPVDPSDVERIDVPTDKRGLLKWLNIEFGGQGDIER